METSSDTRLQAGQALGNYRLGHPLDRRSVIEVWQGQHVDLRVPVALKIMRRNSLQEENLQRYELRLHREARVLANLHHQHIVGYRDYRRSGGFSYIVMQYASYGSVARYYPVRYKLSLHMVRLYTWQVAHALYTLHRRGLIHRDVKPDNILLLHERHTLLADFGLAMHDPALGNERPYIGGTAAYMAPEQYHGYPCSASDQYSLATCVYEWLGGHRPFYGETAHMMHRRERFDPFPVSKFRPELPAAIDEIMLTALHRDPARRYPTVLAFAYDLVEALRMSSEPLTGRIPSDRRVHALDTVELEERLPSTLPRRSEIGAGKLADRSARLARFRV